MADMYTESSANTNLKALADIQSINSITSVANGLLGREDGSGNSLSEQTLRARRIEFFYDKLMLDTIKLGSENNVYLKYCELKDVPEGHAKLMLRRWGGLTEHTVPLAEGVPPKSDMMASESITATFTQYGRYMEFSDRVNFNVIDDVIAHYSMEYGDIAIRTAERLCLKEMMANPNVIFAGSAGNISDMVIGDSFGIADYRAQALRFQRRLVKPLNGYFVVITSPEHIYDLVSDPLVEKYMLYTQTAKPLETGRPVELFNIRFETTMLDDYAYGYTEVSNPGEYTVSSTNYCRVVFSDATTNSVYYLNLAGGAAAGVTSAGDATTLSSLVAKREVLTDVRLKDGSLIPSLVRWDLAGCITNLTDGTNYYVADEEGAVKKFTGAQLKAMSIFQLPTHHSFMFGKEYMVKTGISGRTGAKFYAKQKGSAGVLDPIDQRQSVGYKIDALGFTCLRPEALVRFTFVPAKALETYQAAIDSYSTRFGALDGTAATAATGTPAAIFNA